MTFKFYKSCKCPIQDIVLEYIRIDEDSRTLFRCMKCHGTVGMLDDISTTSQGKIKEKIYPPKRKWTEAELFRMR